MTRVLIVDDRPDNLYLLRALFQGSGYSVDEARHGAEALVKARQAPPDLIVSDILMPVMDGYTLLRHWKADARALVPRVGDARHAGLVDPDHGHEPGATTGSDGAGGECVMDPHCTAGRFSRPTEPQ